MLPGTVTSDSDLIAELLVRYLDSHPGDGLDAALMAVLPTLQGAFSLVLLDHQRLYRRAGPARLPAPVPGQAGPRAGSWPRRPRPSTSPGPPSSASSTRASCWSSTPTGRGRLRPWPAEQIDPKLCLFEFVYLARPDSRLYNQELHGARIRMGELLAEQAPVAADMVMGVPDSGLPAAEGYARRSGIRYGQGLVKNRYIGRTFIVPDQAQRAQGVRRKLNPLRGAIAGQRLVVVDDSIVRGTTTRAMVRDAAGGRRGRGPPPHLLAPLPLAVLLRARHRHPGRAHRRQPRGRRDPEVPERRQPGLSEPGRPQGGDRGAGRRFLRCLPHRPLPERGSGDVGPRAAGRLAGRLSAPWVIRAERWSPREKRSSPTVSPTPRPGSTSTPPTGPSTPCATWWPPPRTARGCSAGSVASAGCSSCRPVTAARCWCRARTGSGTKMAVAMATGRFDTVGIDLVAMCVDDLVCCGARPLFFLDYQLLGQVDPDQVRQVMTGIAAGCRTAGCAIVGGELAEHPGLLRPGQLDVAGFAVGIVERDAIIDGPARTEAGDVLHRLALARAAIQRVLAGPPGPARGSRAFTRRTRPGREPGEWTLADELLRPSVIYTPAVLALLDAVEVHAVAHITGGGLPGNVPRVLGPDLDAVFERVRWPVPRIFAEIQEAGRVDEAEMARVFNLGLGMVVAVPPGAVDEALAALEAVGQEALVVGELVPGRRLVHFRLISPN